jgi:hypothetical protein
MLASRRCIKPGVGGEMRNEERRLGMVVKDSPAVSSIFLARIMEGK